MASVIRSVVTGKYCFTIDFHIKNFDEQQGGVIYIVELILFIFGSIYMENLCVFSLTFFTLFYNCVVPQFVLIAKFVQNLPIHNEKLLRRQLSEITKLHIEALQ